MTKKKYYPPDDDADLAPSRSQQKRDSLALQKMGEELATFSPTLWTKFSISEDLLEALQEFGRIKTHEGKRRQLQLIGKLMRSENVAQIGKEVAELKAGHTQQTSDFHDIEELRDRLLNNDSSAWDEISNLLQTENNAPSKNELKKLEAMVQHIQKTNDKGAYRTLFRTLKTLYTKKFL